jgi:hypothetical protein
VGSPRWGWANGIRILNYARTKCNRVEVMFPDAIPQRQRRALTPAQANGLGNDTQRPPKP